MCNHLSSCDGFKAPAVELHPLFEQRRQLLAMSDDDQHRILLLLQFNQQTEYIQQKTDNLFK